MNVQGNYLHQTPLLEGVIALRTLGMESSRPLAASSILTDSGVEGASSSRLEFGKCFFLDSRIVTFLKWMESRGRVEGETGIFIEKI